MSLFICNKCGCIENSNLMTKGMDEDNTEFPNLCQMEMAGWNEENDEWGDPNYLCSECNCGTWHGEFKKEQADDIEKEIASYSKKGFTTPSDHPDGCLTGGYDNYHVDERYVLFVDIFGKVVNKDNNTLFKIYLEDRKNFNIECLQTLKATKEYKGELLEDDIKLAIKSSQIYKSESQSNTYRYARTTGKSISAMSQIGGLMTMAQQAGFNGFDKYFNSKPHWKETQTVDEKEFRLKKAELKREIKLTKKELNNNPLSSKLQDRLETLTIEYKEM